MRGTVHFGSTETTLEDGRTVYTPAIVIVQKGQPDIVFHANCYVETIEQAADFAGGMYHILTGKKENPQDFGVAGVDLRTAKVMSDPEVN